MVSAMWLVADFGNGALPAAQPHTGGLAKPKLYDHEVSVVRLGTRHNFSTRSACAIRVNTDSKSKDLFNP